MIGNPNDNDSNAGIMACEVRPFKRSVSESNLMPGFEY